MLTREQLRAYREDGYLLLESCVSSGQINELRVVADEFVEESK